VVQELCLFKTLQAIWVQEECLSTWYRDAACTELGTAPLTGTEKGETKLSTGRGHISTLEGPVPVPETGSCWTVLSTNKPVPDWGKWYNHEGWEAD